MTTPSQPPQVAHGLPVTPLCDAIDCFTREEYTRKVYDLLELARKLERKTVDQQAELLALRAALSCARGCLLAVSIVEPPKTDSVKRFAAEGIRRIDAALNSPTQGAK